MVQVLAVSLVMMLSMFGCATGKDKITAAKVKEVEIPKELADEFAVDNWSDNAAIEEPVEVIEKNDKASLAKAIKMSTKTTKKTKKKVKPKSTGFQIPNRRPKNDPIKVGEKITMDVRWLGTKAGTFIISVLPFKTIKDRKVYHLRGDASTSKLFAMVYEANDYVESYVDYEGWFSFQFKLHGDETKHIRDHVELFDHEKKQQYIHIIDNRIQKGEIHEKKGYRELSQFSQDSLSALFYIRTQDLSVGKSIRFPLSTGGKQWQTEIQVIGKEEIRTGMGFRKAIKTKVFTKYKGVLKQKGDTFIWFSDDDRKFPIKFEAKVRIGWVTGVATHVETGDSTKY